MPKKRHKPEECSATTWMGTRDDQDEKIRSLCFDDCRGATIKQVVFLSIVMSRRDDQAEALSVAREGGRPGPLARSTAVRLRKESTFISKIVA